MTVSNTVNEEFRSHLQNLNGVGLSVRVLTKRFLPGQNAPPPIKKEREKERRRRGQGGSREHSGGQGLEIHSLCDHLPDGAPPHVQHQGEGHLFVGERGDLHSRQVIFTLIKAVCIIFFSRELTRALQPLSVGKTSQRILVKNPKTKKKEPSHIFHRAMREDWKNQSCS